MKTLIRIILSSLLAILLPFSLYVFWDPFYRVRNADEDLQDEKFYLSCYEHVLPKKMFDSLIYKLVVKNMDLESAVKTLRYLENHNNCAYLPFFKEKVEQISRFPADTTWVVQLSWNEPSEYEMKDNDIKKSFARRVDYYENMCADKSK